MKLFKLIASKAGRVVYDDRVQADSPREAREQMRTLLGLKSLTGVVYAITEIPVELIQSAAQIAVGSGGCVRAALADLESWLDQNTQP